MKRFLIVAATVLAVATAWAQAPAGDAGQGYPAKIIKIVVPFTAGSATDRKSVV